MIKIYKITYGTLRKISWTKFFEVDEPFTFETSMWNIIIQTWFRTDFWSIPQVLWFFFNPTKYVAYILHDYLYTYKKVWDSFITRLQADDLLFYTLDYEGCEFPEIQLVFWGVRLGGKSHF